jgi:TonB family protein
MRLRAPTLALVFGLAGFAAAQAASTSASTYIDGKSHDVDGIRWSDSLERFSPHALVCKPLAACTLDAVRIRNDSDFDLRCVVRITYPQPNTTGIANLEIVEIIAKKSERSTTQTLNVPTDLAPESFDSACTALPELPKLDRPAECNVSLQSGGMSAGDFYPPGSVRRNEQGHVVLEYVPLETGKASEIVVVRSSEHPDLDSAAIKLIQRAQVSSTCPGRRFRITVPFRLGG